MKFQMKVVELEPGWLFVCFKGPKLPADKRPFWLHQTVNDWLAEHPGQTVQRTLPVQHDGQLVGIHVWLGRGQPVQREVSMKVHHRLKDRLPREHLEALCQHAYEIYFQNADASGALAVVGRGGVAVVFDGRSEAGYVVPFDELQGLDEQAKSQFANWQTNADTNYFVLHLPAGFRAEE